MRYCSQCGNRVNDGDKFCPNCGNDLLFNVNNPNNKNNNDSFNQNNYDYSDNNYNVNTKFAESFVSESNTAWLFIGIIFPLIATIIMFFFVKTKSSDNAKKIVIGQIIRVILIAILIVLFVFIFKSGFIYRYFERMFEFISGME